jgi:hypothetical protein
LKSRRSNRRLYFGTFQYRAFIAHSSNKSAGTYRVRNIPSRLPLSVRAMQIGEEMFDD